MIVLPAIDIKDGQCVRLKQGVKEDKTVYFKDPVAVAKRFEADGAEYLHLVDLDGAFDGEPKNLSVVKAIVDAVHIPVELVGALFGISAAEGHRIGDILNVFEFLPLDDPAVIHVEAGDDAFGQHGCLLFAEIGF